MGLSLGAFCVICMLRDVLCALIVLFTSEPKKVMDNILKFQIILDNVTIWIGLPAVFEAMFEEKKENECFKEEPTIYWFRIMTFLFTVLFFYGLLLVTLGFIYVVDAAMGQNYIAQGNIEMR